MFKTSGTSKSTKKGLKGLTCSGMNSKAKQQIRKTAGNDKSKEDKFKTKKRHEDRQQFRNRNKFSEHIRVYTACPMSSKKESSRFINVGGLL